MTNWWQAGGATGCIQAFQPKNAPSYAASKLDLSGNGNNAAEGVAPAWSAAGWAFNGTSHYLLTGITPAKTYTALIQFTGFNGADMASPFGSEMNFGFGYGVLTFSGQYRWSCSNDGIASAGTPLTSGNLCLAYTSAYINGVLATNAIPGNSANNWPIYIGASSQENSGAGLFCGMTVAAWALYNNTLSAATIVALVAAMRTLGAAPLTLAARTNALTLAARSYAVTVPARSTALTLPAARN